MIYIYVYIYSIHISHYSNTRSECTPQSISSKPPMIATNTSFCRFPQNDESRPPFPSRRRSPLPCCHTPVQA